MSGECILVVDDSKEMVRHLTQRVLPAFGYRTLHAYDGKSGQKLIQEGEPDLIMLDYLLPEMTGLDILRWMAQESISTPVVLITGYGSELSAIEAFRLGAKDYLIKPFTVDEVVEAIDHALVETRLLHDKQELVEQLRRVKVEMNRQSEEMETLFNIGKAIASLLSVDKVLERVLAAAVQLTDAENSVIWLPDDGSEQLRAYERKRAGYSPLSTEGVEEDDLVREVMENGRPVRKSVFSDEGIRLKTGVFAHAILYVPLKLRGLTMGVLSVTNTTALRSFSRRDEFLLSFLADYAAIALENARVFQAADKALAAGLDELNTLIEITRTITSSLDLDEVIRTTIKQVHDSWHIEASSLWLLEENGQSLKVLANVGTPMDILSQFKVPLGEGFVGHVAETSKWIYTNDVQDHPLHYRQVDKVTGFDTRSLLCVPLMARGRVIGALQLLNKIDGDFDDQDVERAITIGAAVAIAVANALLYKEAETRKQHLEVTLEHNDSPILITGEGNHLLLLNQQARNRLELSPDVVGKPVTDVVEWEQVCQLLTCPIDQVPQDEDIVLADGTVWLPRVASIPDHGRILILQDITELRELDKAKDHFVASVSHDMRSPLTAVLGFANNLQAAGSLSKEQQLYVEKIVSSAEQMMDLVNGLLELAKVNAWEQVHQTCDLVQIVQTVLADFQGQALSKRAGLNLKTTGEIATVKGEPSQLRRAVSNLVDNAIKYSNHGQGIDVIVEGARESVLVKVRDRGRGITDADLPHIFDKFYRGRNGNGQGGVGLGLALVQSIVKAHGGKVWAERNADSHGSTFFVRLPRVTGE